MLNKRISKLSITEEEAEKASYSYLISTVVLMVGMPFPILNMIGTLIFYAGCKKNTFFIRIHCLQSLLSQITVILLNSICVTWTLFIIFGNGEFSNVYFGYLFTIAFFNILEFIVSLYAAVQTRKRVDVRFFVFGGLAELLSKKEDNE